ncbi:MAG: ATP-dependent DNA helicase RecG [Candidatus Omnitrophota bacterium]|nr:ATP-dependent DNA helicase RecG [Candidatus Omnitrophota bacterium]
MNNPEHTSIRYLKGVGPKRAKNLASSGINTVNDLFYYFPRRYEDRTNFVPISQLKPGEIQTIKAKVLALGQHDSWRLPAGRQGRRRFNITEVSVADDTGRVTCVWFNQPYLKEYFKPESEVILYGKVEVYGSRLQMSNPEFEMISDETDAQLSVGRLVPVYSLPAGFSQRTLRRLIKNALDEYLSKLKECLPYDIRQRNNLLNLAKALLNIHFPESLSLQKEAYTRLSFEEFFLFQLPLVLRKLKRKDKLGIAHKVGGILVVDFLSGLPFHLTSAQEKVIAEIKSDMALARPMQRLLQGDVGSGKTVVATATSLMAIQGGYQAALMVPTEILAWQHFEKIRSQLSEIRSQKKQIAVGLLTSSAAKKERDKIYQDIREGSIDLLIGTHALLEQGVKFKNLGLVVIDEQHKFGVGQRLLLPAKGVNPDVLIMTATPIPRTLAITLYGDLDVSIINELPQGRLPVKTLLFEQAHRSEAYKLAKEELKLGRQVYIIYPVIDESYVLDISGAKKMYAELKAGEFKDFKVGLIHGRLKREEQDAVMSGFKSAKINVLVSTTVLEVGIDIPNATCMIIEHAERFGLSQLHQLRGRVGRGKDESICVLISDSQTDEAKARLDAMVKYNDGFKIAEEDLRIRGPGEFFGRQQHGLSELKIANPLTQMQLLKRAREEAIKLLNLDLRLEYRQNILLKDKLLQRFPDYEKFMVVG